MGLKEKRGEGVISILQVDTGRAVAGGISQWQRDKWNGNAEE
jgi:hypothetical protein